MKKLIELIATSVTVAVLAVSAVAQQPAATPQQAAGKPQDPQCSAESKLAWYNEFTKNFKADTAKANELAKKWLACPATPAEEEQAKYLKNFVSLFEKANRKSQINDLVYGKKDYLKGFELGKQALAEEPENLKVLIDLAYAGYASKNPALSTESLTYAQKAITMIESGKTLEAWTPYLSKEDTLGYLYNATGSLKLQQDPGVALKDFIKAAQFNGKISKLPATYSTIAQTYEASAYAKLASDYEAKYKGKDETPESKLAVENINQVVDRMIDAYARAVALAGSDPEQQANKKLWMDELTKWYNYRNKSTAGMDQLIAGILAKPMPGEPTPLTTLPASASGDATPATGDTASASGVATPTKPAAPANGTVTKPAGSTTTPAANTTTTGAPKPAAPKPSPKPKRNHGRRG